jgi:hypothetical protein
MMMNQSPPQQQQQQPSSFNSNVQLHTPFSVCCLVYMPMAGVVDTKILFLLLFQKKQKKRILLRTHMDTSRHHLACWLEQEIGVIRNLCNLDTNTSFEQDDLNSPSEPI